MPCSSCSSILVALPSNGTSTTEEKANQIRIFLRSLTCVELSEAVLDAAAQIRREYRVALPDAVIAACALETTSTLVTRNVADFARIDGLVVFDPLTQIQ
ncbi:MAG: PIN domain-containing protein [Phormidesmis sp. CAN_BIN36]|nr:PIN domain-containing protein [Phormidesmis sp. CAN_BIN36]